MAKIIMWILVVAFLIDYLFGSGHDDNQSTLGFLIALSVLVISEAIEKIGRK